MKTVSLLATSILLTTGCVFPDRRAVEPQYVKNFKVEFEHEVSTFEEEFALFSVDYTIREWEKDHGKDHGTLPNGWTVLISSREAVYRGQEDAPFPPWSDDPWFTLRTAGKRAGGWCVYDEQLVYVTLGRWSNLPALYHEFCHIVLDRTDHEDPRWPDWQERGREIGWALKNIWWDREGAATEKERIAQLRKSEKRERGCGEPQ